MLSEETLLPTTSPFPSTGASPRAAPRDRRTHKDHGCSEAAVCFSAVLEEGGPVLGWGLQPIIVHVTSHLDSLLLRLCHSRLTGI